MYKLIHVYQDGILGFRWVDNTNVRVSEFFEAVDEAEHWYNMNLNTYNGPERRMRDFDRRWGHDRRKRVTHADRRLIPHGRRATDHINHYKKRP